MGEGFLFPLLVVVFGALAGALAVARYLLKRKRQQAFQLAALRLGLSYTPEDPFGLLGLPFELLSRGDGRGIENVLYGVWQGSPVHVFDYWYYEESSSGKSRSRTYYRFSCALTPIEARCPHLTIAEETFFTRLADALALDDLQFESEEFNRVFNVKGDHGVGVALLDARMMRWLLERGRGYVFEVHGDQMLAACPRLDPSALAGILVTLRDWSAQVPRVVLSLYPK